MHKQIRQLKEWRVMTIYAIQVNSINYNFKCQSHAPVILGLPDFRSNYFFHQ